MLDTTAPIPQTTNSEAIEAAIRLYDKRHDRSHEFLGSGLGLATFGANSVQLPDPTKEDEVELLIPIRCSATIRVPVSYPNGTGDRVEGEIDAYYVLNTLSLNRIMVPFPTDVEAVPPYLSLIVPLVQLLMMVPLLCSTLPWALGDILRQGYFFSRSEVLKSLFDSHLPAVVERMRKLLPMLQLPNQYTAWQSAIDAVVPSLWPLRSGGVLRQHGSATLLDIAATSLALLQRIELDRAPVLGNVRAYEFELQCQALINMTKWSPCPELAALRGRQLRRKGGQFLTDVDAIGARGKILLLVSCKSIIYDRDYDRGTYSVVRNTQTTIDAAVLHWEAIVSLIRVNPVGDNFNFSSYEEIMGVVCTPFVVYSCADKTLACLKGLHACASHLELREWLNKV